MPATNPIAGAPESEQPQSTVLLTLQSAATADGNGTVGSTDGYNGAQMLELQKSGAGTTTVVPEGSMDGSAWYPIGYYQVDGISSPARTTGPISLPAGSVNHVYQLIDSYPMLRARMAGTSGSVSVLARLYGIPI